MSWEAFEDRARQYEPWYATRRGERVDREERALLGWLLDRFPGHRRVLEVGCGTAHFTRWLASRDLFAIGLDRSPAMLAEARRGAVVPPLLCADADAIPLPDGAVDLVLLVTTLEFLACPSRALRECVRAAERGIVIVALNRWSLGALSRRWGPQARGALLPEARDRSLTDLRRELRSAAGARWRALHWRSALLPRPFAHRLAALPLGDVLGVAVELGPRDIRTAAAITRHGAPARLQARPAIGR